MPLAASLQSRARSEFETNLLVSAQTLAASIGGEKLRPAVRPQLQEEIVQTGEELPAQARVIVVNAAGRLIADSDGRRFLGFRYATARRPELVRATEGVPNTDIRFSNTLGEQIVVAAAPIFDETAANQAGTVGAVRLSESLADVNRNVRTNTLGLVAIGVAGLLAGVLLAYAVAASLARPLGKLARAARRLGDGDLSTRAGNVGGADEVVEVASSFDEMADRVERTVQAQREFVSNASHQLRTPLTGIKLRIENAMADAGDPQRADLVAADHEVDRLSEIVNRLLVMSRQIESGAQTHVDIDEAAARAVDRWRERAERAGSSLELELGRSGGAQGNPADLDQVLDNLLDNAIAYAPGPIVVATGRRDGRIFVAVADRGPGIPAAEMARVTERFYRAAGTPGGGSGLGLAIARGLTEKWGGAMTISTREGGGLRVEVLLRSAHPDRGSGAGLDPDDSRKARPERPDPPIRAEPEEASP